MPPISVPSPVKRARPFPVEVYAAAPEPALIAVQLVILEVNSPLVTSLIG